MTRFFLPFFTVFCPFPSDLISRAPHCMLSMIVGFCLLYPRQTPVQPPRSTCGFPSSRMLSHTSLMAHSYPLAPLSSSWIFASVHPSSTCQFGYCYLPPSNPAYTNCIAQNAFTDWYLHSPLSGPHFPGSCLRVKSITPMPTPPVLSSIWKHLLLGKQQHTEVALSTITSHLPSRAFRFMPMDQSH